MRLILSLSALLWVQLFATDVHICQSCHPIIYNEFQQSLHKKSSINEDKIHKAVWDRHPAKSKGKYKCAKCHTPQNTAHKGISCISCHTITDIKSHSKSNENVYEKKPKLFYSAQKGRENQKVVYQEKSSWFGMVNKTVGSPYHDIDYRNKNFYTGKVCMGCHSHKKNGHNFDVCKIDMEGASDKKSNCISCHMPKIKGSSTTIRKTDTHAFHGFAGARNAPEMLSKYVELKYKKTDKGFNITIENNSPRPLLSHPLRVVKLKTTLKREGVSEALETHTFVRILGTNNKPSMPWLATQVVKDNMLKANEKRVIGFEKGLKSGDELEVTLGFIVVNPKVAPKLGLDKDPKLTKFTPLKKSYFKIK